MASGAAAGRGTRPGRREGVTLGRAPRRAPGSHDRRGLPTGGRVGRPSRAWGARVPAPSHARGWAGPRGAAGRDGAALPAPARGGEP